MDRLGDYTIERELARGGMGVVYVARDPSGRQVALKLLLDRSDPFERQRFRREAEAIGRIDHPGVVRVHSLGEDERGRDYIVLGLIEGESLAERLEREGPLPPRAAAALARALADALAAAHAKGVLHRDIKPSNVLIPAEDGAPVLTDFGLARITNQSQRLTETGTMHGTPAYMPPEQAQGELDRIGPPSDIYGLGALLFHALTGRAPFVGSNPMAILLALLSTPAPRPSSLSAAVPPALDAVVGRCLEKVPTSRYRSAEALRAALDDFLTGPAERSTRRPGLALLAAAVAVLLAAAVWVGRSSPKPPAPLSPQPTALPSPATPVAGRASPTRARWPLRFTHPESKGLPAKSVGVRYVTGGLLSWALHGSRETSHSSARWGPLEGTWTPQWTFPGEFVTKVEVGPRGAFLLLHSRRVVWVSDPTQAPVEVVPPTPNEQLTAVAFWPEGPTLAVAVNPSGPQPKRVAQGVRIDLYRWSRERLERQAVAGGHRSAVQDMAFDVRGRLISCSGNSSGNPGGLLLVHDATGRETGRLVTASLIRTVAINRKYMALGDTLSRVQVATAPWVPLRFRTLVAQHAQGATLFKSAVSASGSIHGVTLSGERLFARTWSTEVEAKNELLLWDLRSARTPGGMTHFPNLRSFDVSPDGSRIAIGLLRAEDGATIEVWPVEHLAAKLARRADWTQGH